MRAELLCFVFIAQECSVLKVETKVSYSDLTNNNFIINTFFPFKDYMSMVF